MNLPLLLWTGIGFLIFGGVWALGLWLSFRTWGEERVSRVVEPAIYVAARIALVAVALAAADAAIYALAWLIRVL